MYQCKKNLKVKRIITVLFFKNWKNYKSGQQFQTALTILQIHILLTTIIAIITVKEID